MADDRHYVGGDNYLLDDLSGFKIRASIAKLIPGGQTGNLAVAPARWEPQQPQDFVTGIADDMTVALSRPRQVNQFVLVGTSVVAAANAGATALTVDSTVGFTVGNRCQVALDNGNIFYFTLTTVASPVLTFAVQPLPSGVGGTFGDPLENSVINLTSVPA